MGRDSDGGQRYQRYQAIADATFRPLIEDDWLLPELVNWVTRLEGEAAACATPPVRRSGDD